MHHWPLSWTSHSTMISYRRITYALLLFFFYFDYFIIADEFDGICDITPTKNKTRYVLDETRNKWVLETYKVPIGPATSVCCEGYRNASGVAAAVRCEPVCDPPCVKATCDAPDTCVCLDGHEMSNGSNSTCFDVCDACVNSRCFAGATECVCDPGYEKGASQPHVCHPVCSPACENGVCRRPGRCDCRTGYRKRQQEGVVSDNVCVPQCGDDGCLHGTCVGPNQCSCRPGYALDEYRPYVCRPVCEPNCTNGFCTGPNVCGCGDGMEIHSSNRTLCVPMPSENSRGSCKANVSEAITFDPTTKCFTVASDLTMWWMDSYCTPVDGVLKDCSKPVKNTINNSTLNCTLNFRCQAYEQPDNRFKIECSLYDPEDFHIESYTNDVFIGSQRDVELTINAFTKRSRTNADGETINVWTLRRLNSSPVCGQMDFRVELSSTLMNFRTKNQLKDRHIILWLPVLFVVITILGGFLWFRKRILGVKLQNENRIAFGNPMYVDRAMLVDTIPGEADADTHHRPIRFGSPLQITEAENEYEVNEGESVDSPQYESIDEIGLVS